MKTESIVDDTMAILDEEITPPQGLAKSIIQEIDKIDYVKTRKLNPINIIQVAAAILFGIFIGHQFGKNTEIILKKEEASQIDKYIRAHHLNLEDNDLNSFPFMTN